MLIVRVLGATAGAIVVLGTSASVLTSLVVPRRPGSRLTCAVETATDWAFRQVAGKAANYRARDRVLAVQAPLTLLLTLLSWLLCYLVGYGLLLWATADRGTREAFREAGSSLFTLGFAASGETTPTAVNFLAAATGIVVVALQIGYLPTLYAAYNRRETEVTLLTSRASAPAWGPELLARTCYELTGDERELPELYRQWERFAADIAESHSSYPALIRFRSPGPLSSWLVALLAVLDSAALYLALCPRRAPFEARLCLRMGFVCLRRIAATIGIHVDPDPRPDAPIQITIADFEAAVATLQDVGFAIERNAADAWPHFQGWRVNYEPAAYAIAYAIDAVPALWSGPRRHSREQIVPLRPVNRAPGGAGPGGTG